MIRPATPDDKDALLALAEATGLFEPHELEVVAGGLTDYFDGRLGADHGWIVDEHDQIAGGAYYAPEMADKVWNLLFIGVHPDRQGEGHGGALLRYVEQQLTERGARLLLVETSGLPSFELTRKFYRNHDYDEEARIRDFYKPGDDKIIFRKTLAAPES